MVKKLLAACCMAFALFAAAAPSPTAEARDYYVGTYSDGTAAYIVTESVNLLLSQSLHSNFAVFIGKIVNTALDTETKDYNAQCYQRRA